MNKLLMFLLISFLVVSCSSEEPAIVPEEAPAEEVTE